MSRSGTTWLAGLPHDWSPPVTLAADYKGYEILRFDGRVFGFKKSAGSFDFLRDDINRLTDAVVAPSAAAAKRAIDNGRHAKRAPAATPDRGRSSFAT